MKKKMNLKEFAMCILYADDVLFKSSIEGKMAKELVDIFFLKYQGKKKVSIINLQKDLKQIFEYYKNDIILLEGIPELPHNLIKNMDEIILTIK